MITNYDDVIDSRDIIERINELESSIGGKDTYEVDEDEVRELESLKALARECEGSEWECGVTLIRDSYFEEYAQGFAEDCCEMPRDIGWPFNHIDWEQATKELQMDYTEVDFDGVSYWVRL